MIIDDALLSKLERLSALKIPDEKREEFKGQLNNIVDFVEILNELSLEGGEVAITTLKRRRHRHLKIRAFERRQLLRSPKNHRLKGILWKSLKEI